MRSFLFVFCTLFTFTYAVGQGDLSFYCDAMVNLDNQEHRKSAGSTFLELIDKDLNQPQSFGKPYTELKWISIQYPQDSSFRTITWQIDLGDGAYEYYGYIQSNDGTIHKIDTQWGDDAIDELSAITWDKWSGGLVYNIISSHQGYTLFTFRYIDEFTKVKTCETISFENEKAWLGATPKFETTEGSGQFKNRLSLQFSADSNGTLNYDAEAKRIVYDNLIPVMGRIPGQGPTQVPDGSYKGFEYKGGEWQSIDKLFDQISEQAPRRAQTKNGRDLFGRTGG